MSEPFIGEVRFFGFNWAPKSWALCDGSLLSIAQNQALFSILGTTYGGNGVNNFALPDLRGRVPVHFGNGVSLGQSSGEEQHTLVLAEMPAHDHMAVGDGNAGASTDPGGNVWAAHPSIMQYAGDGNVALGTAAIAPAGGSQAHSNVQPYLVGNYCIAIYGIYPSRS